jgi:ribosomal protein S18 acetylase RimI-like enzyme
MTGGAVTSTTWRSIRLIYYGRRIGKRLIDECLAGLKRAGLQRANILVAKDNPRGLDFWRRCGWEDLDGAAAMGIDV